MPNDKDLIALFYRTAFCPVTVYDSEQNKLFAFPEILEKVDMTGAFLPELLRSGQNPEYCVTRSFAYLGMVRRKKDGMLLILGPVLGTDSSAQTLHEFLREAALPASTSEDVKRFFYESPAFSLNRLLDNTVFLHAILNGEILDTSSFFGIADTASGNPSGLEEGLSQAKEEGASHNTYYYEQYYLSLLEEGKTDQLRTLFSHASINLQAGKIADTPLRQMKNIAIVSLTLATRHAIAGGLDPETAYQLSDMYLQEAERMQRGEDLQQLQLNAILDFSDRVAALKVPEGMSREIYEVVQFVRSHTYEPIGVEDAAESIHRSRSYTSRTFKKEMGFDLSSFILTCRLEDAKSLLAYTDKSLAEISTLLCFSSQSYFQSAFKKKFGITPMQFRQGKR